MLRLPLTQRPHRLARRKTRYAFTLLEVLLVLAILGIIMSLVVPQLMGRQTEASIDATRLSIRGLDQALKIYALDHSGRYPNSNNGLSVLVTRPSQPDPRWKGPYLETLPLDAWGNPFEYRFPGSRDRRGYDIISAGPDQTMNTEDDITNASTTESDVAATR